MRNKKFILILLLSFMIIISCVSIFIFFQSSEKPSDSSSDTPSEIPIIIKKRSFKSKWDTTRIASAGSSASNQILLPLESTGVYNFTVNWGDGTKDRITKWNQTEVNHTYPSEGVYVIKINGILNGWCFNFRGDRLKILEIEEWGDLRLGNSGNYFDGCFNLEISASDVLNLTGTTTLECTFRNCYSLSNIERMNEWDTSKVTNMYAMFLGAKAFNQPIGNWNTSKVTNMSCMFENAKNFNRPIGSWDVSSVTDMSYMFKDASFFNQSIGSWDVSSVINMSYMFYHAGKFNQPISNWDVSSVVDMSAMFCGTNFNQPIGNWDVSNVVNMNDMFCGSNFNQPIGNWDVSSVTDMRDMFKGASIFNQSIGSWDVSSVTNMYGMFWGASIFNQSLDSWDVSSVTNMYAMFAAAKDFNQPLGSWDVSNVINMDYMFFSVNLSISNYDNLLIGWAALPSLQNNVKFDAGNSKYSSAAITSRTHLTDPVISGGHNWSIEDGGQE